MLIAYRKKDGHTYLTVHNGPTGLHKIDSRVWQAESRRASEGESPCVYLHEYRDSNRANVVGIMLTDDEVEYLTSGKGFISKPWNIWSLSGARCVTQEQALKEFFNGFPTAYRDTEYEIALAKLQAPSSKAHFETATGAMREKKDALPYDLVPFEEITAAYIRVAEFGAKKYEPWNWSKGLMRVQLMGSLLRHVFAYIRGEDRDKESGLLHTDHILWNAATLSHNVHWNLEDGRRAEPPRDYRDPEKHKA